jgi:glucose/arabinose dehydrogenase
VFRGEVKRSGSVLRCKPDGSELELVARGLRNPYGKAFSPDGRPLVTEHNIDKRGHGQIFGDTEDLYEIREGAWYGWPDYAGGFGSTTGTGVAAAAAVSP